MTIEEMKARKIELGLTSEMIAEESGIPLGTVQKIFGGTTKAPRRKTIEALEKVLFGEKEKKPLTYVDIYAAHTPLVREDHGGYSTARRLPLRTIDDYYALPEDQRVELINGVFYDMGAPSLLHQKILGDLYILFRECAEQHKDMSCKVYLSPCDVRLNKDNYTMVQPDLLVICKNHDGKAIRYEGAPDLVVEILSPSSRSKDMVLKLYKYQEAGVREYWIVDPQHETLTVHLFDSEDYDPKKYSFQDEVPIGISEGRCSIELSRYSADWGMQ